MFISPQLPLTYDQHPWDVSFDKRLSMLCSKDQRVAYFYENPDTSTFRYRVFNMVEALNSGSDGAVSASWFTRADASRMNGVIDRADALVLGRIRYGPVVDRVVRRARTRKIPVLFDVDDLVFDPNYVPLLIDSIDQDIDSEKVWDNWFAYTGRFGATLRRCDKAIATNQYLAERIADSVPGMPTRVVPNFLNRAQQERSCTIWEAKKESGFRRDSKIHIGYFSGSPTHNRDFHVASQAIAAMLEKDPRTILRVVGFLGSTKPGSIGHSLEKYRDRIEMFPLQNFLALQDLIGQVEINVAPLQNNTFTNCKSELKFFEAAIVGTLTVASPTFAFRNSIRDGENGLTASAHEWETKLEAALAIVDDRERYIRMAQCAYDAAGKHYGWDRSCGQIVSAIFE